MGVGVTDLLLWGSKIAVLLFVVSSTLAVGLGLTVGQILAPLANIRLVALSLVANFVLAPLAAFGLWHMFDLDDPLGVGLLLCGLAAGAPFLIKLAEFARADMAFAVGLMVLLMVVTVGYVPLILPIFVAGTAVNPGRIAVSLLVVMLIPLAAGLALRARRAGVAARIQPVVAKVSTVSMILVIASTITGNFASVVSVFGTFAILAAVVFTVLCAGIGWLMGGAGTREVLALGIAQRNAAAAFVVAAQNFEDPKVVVMITVVLIIEFLMLLPFARMLARGR